MVEILKTEVRNISQANLVRDIIHQHFPLYNATIDIEDCDKVLRVSSDGAIETAYMISLLEQYGFYAEILPDELPEPGRTLLYENEDVYIRP